MTEFTKSLPNFSPDGPAFWCAVAFGLAFVTIWLRRRDSRVLANLPGPHTLDFTEADAWLPPTREEDERRSAVRRDHQLVEVEIMHPSKPKRIVDGIVVNRSVAGVRLALKAWFATGTILLIRAVDAPTETPWTRVIVRNSEEVGDYFKLGCQFEATPPWNVLLMFG